MGTLDDFQQLLKDGFLNPDSTTPMPAVSAHAQMPDPSIHVHPENVRKGSVARALLRGAHTPERLKPQVIDMTRPLIDVIQQGSVEGWPGLFEIADHRQFQQTLRKAKCFTLDEASSRLMAEFSIAISADLDTVRQMAVPPFPVTWIEFDNVARVKRMESMGVPLTPTAKGEVEGNIVSKVGWLIEPAPRWGDDGHYVTYFTVTDQGPIMAPVSWFWATSANGKPLPPTPPGMEKEFREQQRYLERLALGIRDTNVKPEAYTVGYGPQHKMHNTGKYERSHFDLMNELAGELRHVWALLLTMAAGHAGLTTSTSPKARPSGPDPIQPNGKPLLPIEHKHLHLHLGKRYTPQRVVLQAITHHRKRHHEVRAHLRRLPTGRLVPVKSHARGDRALGSITKDYRVEK